MGETVRRTLYIVRRTMVVCEAEAVARNAVLEFTALHSRHQVLVTVAAGDGWIVYTCRSCELVLRIEATAEDAPGAGSTTAPPLGTRLR